MTPSNILKFPDRNIQRKADDLVREANTIYARSIVLIIEAVDLQMALLRMFGGGL